MADWANNGDWASNGDWEGLTGGVAVTASAETETAQAILAILVDQFIAVPWASETEAAQSISAVAPSVAGTGWGIPIGIT